MNDPFIEAAAIIVGVLIAVGTMLGAAWFAWTNARKIRDREEKFETEQNKQRQEFEIALQSKQREWEQTSDLDRRKFEIRQQQRELDLSIRLIEEAPKHISKIEALKEAKSIVPRIHEATSAFNFNKLTNDETDSTNAYLAVDNVLNKIRLQLDMFFPRDVKEKLRDVENALENLFLGCNDVEHGYKFADQAEQNRIRMNYNKLRKGLTDSIKYFTQSIEEAVRPSE